MPVRVGMSTSSSVVAPTPGEGARWIVERAAAAHRAELDLFSLGDNHIAAKAYYQNVPMLGAAAREFPAAPLGCLFLLPLWNAVICAEQIGTLAALTDQTFVVQTGLGPRRRAEQMGIGVAHMGRRLEASIMAVRSLLAGEVTSSAELGIDGARISPIPVQPVEWWIGGTAETAIRRAARLGDVWYATPGTDVEQSREQLDRYLAACSAVASTPRAALRRDVIVLADGDRAAALGDELAAAGYRGMRRDVLVCGSPERAAEQLAPYVELGFGDITCRCMSIPQRDAIETIELLGEVRRLLQR